MKTALHESPVSEDWECGGGTGRPTLKKTLCGNPRRGIVSVRVKGK